MLTTLSLSSTSTVGLPSLLGKFAVLAPSSSTSSGYGRSRSFGIANRLRITLGIPDRSATYTTPLVESGAGPAFSPASLTILPASMSRVNTTTRTDSSITRGAPCWSGSSIFGSTLFAA